MKVFYASTNLAYLEFTLKKLPFPFQVWVCKELETAVQQAKTQTLMPPPFLMEQALKEGFKRIEPLTLELEVPEEKFQQIRLKNTKTLPFSKETLEKLEEEIEMFEILGENLINHCVGVKIVKELPENSQN